MDKFETKGFQGLMELAQKEAQKKKILEVISMLNQLEITIN